MHWVEAIGANSWGLAALLPIALASSVMPMRILVAVRLSGPGRPLAHSLAFLAGNWAWRLVVGGVVLSAFDFDSEAAARIVVLVLGVLAALAAGGFAVAAVVAWRRPKEEAFAIIDRWAGRFDDLEPSSVFLATLAVSWAPGAQWVFLIAAASVIRTSGVDRVDQALALAVFAALQLVLVATPVVVGRTVYHRSDAMVRLEEWLRTRILSGAALKLAMSAIMAVVAWMVFAYG